MKTKIRLRQGGVRNHPLWHIVVQGEKKNLRGKYIEKIGYWMPRQQKTYKRGIVLNKHKMRYWLSVGAQPTGGVIRLLNKYDFYPNRPTPHGTASVYEKPEKVYSMQGWKLKGKPKDNAIHYQQLLQGQMNIIERQRRVQAEAMANLGVDNQMDLELARTDDIDSEEGDIFERVKKFEELQKRFSKHRKEQQQLKGNDLRYNVYLNKIHKLTRMDLGLDVEGYKDYVHNLKMFAKYNEDYQIFANDQLYPERGTTHDPSLGSRLPGNTTTPHPSQPNFDAEGVDYRKINQRDAELFNKLRNTVGKIHREHQSVITQEDRDNIEDFAERTDHYLNYDYELALDIKHLYDKRILEQKERKEMGMVHIAQVTDADLEACGVSKREFALIRKLLDLDNDIFAYRDHREESAFYYAVDLSKYDQKKIPKDCKEMMYRPNKMRRLYERYWQVASHLDKKARETLEIQKAKRYYPRKLAKTEEQYELMDRMVEIVDIAVAGFKKEEKEGLRAATGHANPKMATLKLVTNLQKTIILQAKGKDPDTPPKLYFKDQFQYEAEKVMQLIRVNGEATKSQLQYLIMYNDVMATDRQYFLEKEQRNSLRIWEPVEHEEVEVKDYAIGQLKEQKESDATTDQEGMMSSGEERQQTPTETEESSTTDEDGLTKHRMENVTAMTPEEYLRYKRGIKEEIYGPAKREDGVIGLHNIGVPESEEMDIRDIDPNAVTYDHLHSQALLRRDVAKLEEQVKGLEDIAQTVEESELEFNSSELSEGEEEQIERMEEEAEEDFQRVAKKTWLQNAYMEERLEDAVQEMGENLPAELMEKFHLLQQLDNLDFEEQTECLSYFVDKMKSDVITSLVDKSDALEKMDEQDRKEFYLTLDDLVNDCSNQLFHLHQQKADREQGKLTKDSEDFKITVQNLQSLFETIDLIDSQFQQLSEIQCEREDLVGQGLRPLGEEFDYHDKFKTIQEIKPDLGAPEEYDEKYDPALQYVQMPTDMDKLPHWKELHHTEAAEILDRLSFNLANEIENKEDVHDFKMEQMLDRMYLTSRFQLDYAKLFHGHEGGYPVEKLRTILSRIQSDQEDFLHPFLDPKAEEDLDHALEYLALKRLYKRTGFDGFKVETTTSSDDEHDEDSPFKSTKRQKSDDEGTDHIVADQEAVNQDGEDVAPAQEGEEIAVPEPTIQKIQWQDKWDDEDYEATQEDYDMMMIYESQVCEEYLEEIVNEDGTIDQDKLAEKVKFAKELDIKDLECNSSGGEELLDEFRQDFIEDAERERDDEEVNEDRLPDPVGLNRFQKQILDELEDPADELIIKEILLMLAEKQEDELDEDYFGNDEEDPEMIKRLGGGQTRAEKAHHEKVLDALEQRYKLEYGWELHDIEDPEEFKTAYVEYVKKAVLKKKKQKYKKTIEDIEHEKWMRDDAIYRQLFELMQGADMPISLVSGEFQPNKYGRIKEMQRIEANIGRYPMGYRHYENYHNYKLQNPNSTIQDYQTDVNSPISFEEFFELKKRSFIYECKYNPMVYYENGFDKLDPDDEEDRKKMPENIAEQEDFRQDAQELFMQRTHQLLMEKKHFTKVEALEMFTNFWSFGRGIKHFPTHNIYVPVTETIMPRPKFQDMNKWNDQEGKDWTYRTRDSHSFQRAFNMPTTIKPSPMSPAPPKMDKVTPWLAADSQHHLFKWNKYRRLSKSRRDSHTSINMPVKWKSFSTSTRNSMTEDQEQKLIQDFNSFNPLRPSVFDKPTYNPFKVFANHFFNK